MASALFGIGNGLEGSRKGIRDSIDKAIELRQRIAGSSSPITTRSSAAAAQDYPVFMPSYGDEKHLSEIRTMSETWGDSRFGLGNVSDSGVLGDGKESLSSRKGFRDASRGYESHICPVDDDRKSMTATSVNNVTIPEASPGSELYKSVPSSNRCRPAVITSVQSNTTMPSTNPRPSVLPQQMKVRHGGGGGAFLSWLLPRIKKKYKSENSPNLKDLGTVSTEGLKNELIQAREHRDDALTEVSAMRSSLLELRDKLEYLETYCEGLKKALKRAMEKESRALLETSEDVPMPVSEEAMKEGFLQVVSEARLSVKQFCKTLIGQVQVDDADSIDSVLRPLKLSIDSRNSKAVFYHLEGIINQALYQDFDNCVFRRSGSSTILDLHQDRQSRFAAFVSLRNLSWNDVLSKGTKHYSEELSLFCDQKMVDVISTLNWTRPWPEHLLQSFFVSAKCVWLLHLLAFSFDPSIRIFRVEKGSGFDSRYMEDVFASRQRPQGPSRVKAMVCPGFYVDDRVLRCKVICRYKSIP